MRTAPVTRTRFPQSPQSKRYGLLILADGQSTHVNKSTGYWVIIGASWSKSASDETLFIEVPASGGGQNIVDGQTIVGASLEYSQHHRMLVPPNGTVLASVGPQNMIVIECETLEDALAIL